MNFEICSLHAMPTELNDINAFDTITCLTGLSDIAVSSTMTYSVSLTARYIAVISSNNLLDLCEVEIYTGDEYDSTTQSANDHFVVAGNYIGKI